MGERSSRRAPGLPLESPEAEEERYWVSRRAILKAVGGFGLGAGALLEAAACESPTILTKTGQVTAPPGQLHLQFGADPARSMVASWATAQPVSNPRLQYGTDRSDTSQTVPAVVRTYTDGFSRTTVYTNHAVMGGLSPNTTYFYQVLHDGSQPVRGQFRTAPAGRTRFTFTSFGDQSIPDQMGKPATEPWTRYSSLVVDQIEKARPLFHLLNGDLCYANVKGREHLRPQVWRSFFDNNSRSARNRAWMPAAGNHENEMMNGRPWTDPFKAYQTWFQLPSNGSSSEFQGLWYAFTVGSVRFISLNNDDVCYQDGGNTYVRGYSHGAQKSWLERTLAAARVDAAIDWIVVCMHQVAMSTAIPFNGSDLGIREEWLPLFDRYGVDLVVAGHEHHYERTLPVRGQTGQYLQPVAASHDVDLIDTTRGTVHMIIGGGGHNQSSYNFYSVKDGMFESELLVPVNAAGTPSPGQPVALVNHKPREQATWSATALSSDPVRSHARDSQHGYGFCSFEVDPGSPGGPTTLTVRYHRVLDPQNPADASKARDYDSFVLKRPRSDG